MACFDLFAGSFFLDKSAFTIASGVATAGRTCVRMGAPMSDRFLYTLAWGCFALSFAVMLMLLLS